MWCFLAVEHQKTNGAKKVEWYSLAPRPYGSAMVLFCDRKTYMDALVCGHVTIQPRPLVY